MNRSTTTPLDNSLRTSDTGPRLIIVCGLPGSGKTTHARLLEERLNAVRLAADDWMEALSIDLYDEAVRAKVETLQWELARALLQHGLVVIVEWGTWARSERDALRLGARQLGAAVELHYLSAPNEVLLERVRRRGREAPAIELADIQRWRELIEIPTAEEMSVFDPPTSIGLGSD